MGSEYATDGIQWDMKSTTCIEEINVEDNQLARNRWKWKKEFGDGLIERSGINSVSSNGVKKTNWNNGGKWHGAQWNGRPRHTYQN